MNYQANFNLNEHFGEFIEEKIHNANRLKIPQLVPLNKDGETG
jgi:hypothetical protein